MLIKTTTTMRTLFAAISLSLVPTGLALTAESLQDLDCGRLKTLLKQSGWQIEFTDTDDLVLIPPSTVSGGTTSTNQASPILSQAGAAPDEPAQANSTQTVEDFVNLQQRLEAVGWIVEQDVEGALLVHWPEKDVDIDTSPSLDTNTIASPAETSDADPSRWQHMQQTLTQSGRWRTEKNAAGDLLIYPIQATTPVFEPTKETSTINTDTPNIPVVPTAATKSGDKIPASNFDAVQERLESTGWNVSKTDDGSLIVVWDAEPAIESTSDQTEMPQKTSQIDRHITTKAGDKIMLSDFDSLTQRLEHAGWEVTKNQYGALLVRWKQAPSPVNQDVALPSSLPTTNYMSGMAGMVGIDAPNLQSALEATGNWHTERTDTGDLLLFPQSASSYDMGGMSSMAGLTGMASISSGMFGMMPILDSDGDGVPNPNDLCPGTTLNKAVDQAGCEGSIMILRGVNFETGSAVLVPSAKKILDRQASVMQRYRTLRYRVVGHTDNVGTASDNLDLSQRRALTVRKYLVSKGVNQAIMDAEGRGEVDPIGDNTTADGRLVNRRVELHMLGSQ